MSWYDDWLKNRIQGEINDLMKADTLSEPSDVPDGKASSADSLPESQEQIDASKEIGRKSVIDDPYFDHFAQQNTYKLRMSRLTNRTLKEVSMRDWLISSIIQCRVDTLLQFSRPNHDRHKMGFMFEIIIIRKKC